jgi:SAM-dependent methyltransferase
MSIYPTPTTLQQRVKALLRDRIWRNSSRVHLDELMASVGGAVAPGTRVLDAGAGVAPYRRHFEHARYETADFAQVDKGYGQLDYVCDLTDIPVEDDRYGTVLLTQVLEHVPEPGRVLRELRRVMAPGGLLVMTAPLFYPEHEQPHDYYRYTQYGFRHQIQSAGLEVESIEWLEGYAGTVSYQLKEAALRLPASPSAYGGGPVGLLTAAGVLIARLPFLGLSALLASADVRRRHTESGQCKNYVVVARKSPNIVPG